MSQHHTWPGLVAMWVVGGRLARGALARPRWAFCPAWASTRLKLDSLAKYTPSSASIGTMRAGGTAAKRGSLTTAINWARSNSFKAWLGVGRCACGLRSPDSRPSCVFQRCRVRGVMPALWQAGRRRALARCAMLMLLASAWRSASTIIRPLPCCRSPRLFLTAPRALRSRPAPDPCATARARAP